MPLAMLPQCVDTEISYTHFMLTCDGVVELLPSHSEKQGVLGGVPRKCARTSGAQGLRAEEQGVLGGIPRKCARTHQIYVSQLVW